MHRYQVHVTPRRLIEGDRRREFGERRAVDADYHGGDVGVRHHPVIFVDDRNRAEPMLSQPRADRPEDRV